MAPAAGPAQPCVLIAGADGAGLAKIAQLISTMGWRAVRRETLEAASVDAKRHTVSAIICVVAVADVTTELAIASLIREACTRELPIVLVSREELALEALVRRFPTTYRIGADQFDTAGMRLLNRLLVRTSAQPRVLRSSAPPPSPSLTRAKLKERFFATMTQELSAAQRYLIGGVLGERAHEVLLSTLQNLKGEAALSGGSPVIVMALSRCEELADAAQKDVRAMTRLAACCEWLATLGPDARLPHSLEDLPLFRSSNRVTLPGD